MREEYDFSNAQRAHNIPHLAKLQEAVSSQEATIVRKQAAMKPDNGDYDHHSMPQVFAV